MTQCTKIKSSFFIFFISFIPFFQQTYGATSVQTSTARAYLDKNKKQLEYIEKHTAYFEGNQVTQSVSAYFDPQGKKIAELKSDYTKSMLMPTYVFKDFKRKSEEGLRWDGKKYVIFYKENLQKEQTSELEETKGVFSCQGWHYYLVQRLDQFTANKDATLDMKLIFPSKLDYYSFRVRNLNAKAPTLKLRLEFDSWVIRLFAPHLDITYNQEKKMITKYYGPSNILDKDGEIQNVYIFYDL